MTKEEGVAISTEASTPWPWPLIGDTTSSAERAGDPTSWALAAPTRAALAEAIAARRDVRRFRPDTVADDILHEVLAAGHAAPSAGALSAVAIHRCAGSAPAGQRGSHG
jgi:hypothetical protein